MRGGNLTYLGVQIGRLDVVNAEIVKLRNIEAGRWAIGGPPDIKVGENRYSKVIQIKYNTKKNVKNEKYHYHTSPIEEYYLVLKGSITVLVDGEEEVIKALEILPVPPRRWHKVSNLTSDAEFLVFRAPPSTDETKVVAPAVKC